MTENKRDREDYSPYCKLCTGCGEDGCCSHIACFSALIENPECDYGKTYLRDARYADKMYKLGSNIIEKLREKTITAEQAVEEYEYNADLIYDEVYTLIENNDT